MRKRILIAVALIAVGAGAAGATVAFTREGPGSNSCSPATVGPNGTWTAYCPDPEIGK